MTASEKLKTLDTPLPANLGEWGDEVRRRGAIFLDALPQIVAVVEAAETLAAIQTHIRFSEMLDGEERFMQIAKGIERYRVDVLLKEVEAAERERDEALHAEEVAEQYREKAEARVVELEAASRPLPA